MTDVDAREKAARFYDLSPGNPNEDIAFYRERLPSTEASVLELGCGTGRVLIPLSESCSCIHGVDASDPMITICREKLAERGRPPSKVNVETGDITSIHLGRTFDQIIAPFRVLQNLESDEQVDGLFDTVRAHLGPGGRCILNVFQPNRDPETLRTQLYPAQCLDDAVRNLAPPPFGLVEF